MKRNISILIVTTLLVFLLWKIAQDFDGVKNLQWEFDPKNLFPLLLVILPAPFVNALSWHLMTKSLGGSISFKDNFKIWTYSNAARFLPGSVWQYAGRVYMLSQKGVSKTLTSTALMLEAILNVATASAVVMLTFDLKTAIMPPAIQKMLIPFVVFVAIIVVIFTGRRITFFENTMRSVLKNDGLKLSKINLNWLPLILLSVLTQFLLAGLALFFIALAANLPTIGLQSVLPFMGIYAASWLVGYLSFLVPSGLGIREASIAGLLTPYMAISIGGIVAVIFRVTATISEAITILTISILYKKRSP